MTHPSGAGDAKIEQVGSGRSLIRLTMEIQRFHLPPVESVLVIGRRASIGPHAMEKALTEMMPGEFRLISLEHPVIEAVLVRASHLRRIPEDKLLPIILRQCDGLMDETDMLHFELDVRIRATEEIEV